MNYHNYEKAKDYEVIEWIEKNIELTPYQKEKLKHNETVRFAPFQFYKQKKKTKSFLIRLSIIFIPFVIIILWSILPIKFILTGEWGFENNQIKWYDSWINKI